MPTAPAHGAVRASIKPYFCGASHLRCISVRRPCAAHTRRYPTRPVVHVSGAWLSSSVTPLPFSPVSLPFRQLTVLSMEYNITHDTDTPSLYKYLHVSDDYWDAPPVGVLHQPPPKLHVLRPSLWSLHDRLANVVPHTGGM